MSLAHFENLGTSWVLWPLLSKTQQQLLDNPVKLPDSDSYDHLKRPTPISKLASYAATHTSWGLAFSFNHTWLAHLNVYQNLTRRMDYSPALITTHRHQLERANVREIAHYVRCLSSLKLLSIYSYFSLYASYIRFYSIILFYQFSWAGFIHEKLTTKILA